MRPWKDRPDAPVLRTLLIFVFCAFTLLPCIAAADGTGGTEPPIQDPVPDSSSADGSLITIVTAVISAVMAIP